VTHAALMAVLRLHAALAWMSVAALAAALFATLSRRSFARPVVAASAALCAATFITGAMLHLPFQSKLRQRLFLLSSSLGWMFERKEHVAFGVLALSGCVLFATWAERAAAQGGDARAARSLRRASVIALAAALAFAGFSAAVSLAVSRRVSF
jgi:hypothetical protein